MRSTSGRSPAAAASLTASLTAPSVLWCWITLHALGRQALDATLARAAVNADDRDRGAGEALITAAITVGGLIIAGIVLAVLKTKATTIVNNVCTNADPSSC